MRIRKRMKKETGRFLIDHTNLIDRDDAYVTFGLDYKKLTKDTQDEYYSLRDPKYWIDHHILVEWLMCGKSTVLEKCSTDKFQEWYLKEHGAEYEVKWLSQDDAAKLVSHMQSLPLNPKSPNLYQKELKRIKHLVLRFFNQFSYKDSNIRTRNYFFKSVGEHHIAGELQLFITYLSAILARYRTLLFIQDQLHKKIDRMMKSKTDREKLRYQFGALIKVTYRKNNVLLKALCYKIDQLMKCVTYPDRLLKIIPFILSKLDIFPPETTHKKRDCKTDRRKLCSNVDDCYNRKFDICNKGNFKYIIGEAGKDGLRLLKKIRASIDDVKAAIENPAELDRLYKKAGLSLGEKKVYSLHIMSLLRDYKEAREKAQVACIEKRKNLCDTCTNREKSPFQNLCPQGAERYHYFVQTAVKTETIKEISSGMQWIAQNNLLEVNDRCPFCNMKLYRYNLTSLHCLNCKSAFPFSARNNLQVFIGTKATETIGIPLKKALV